VDDKVSADKHHGSPLIHEAFLLAVEGEEEEHGGGEWGNQRCADETPCRSRGRYESKDDQVNGAEAYEQIRPGYGVEGREGFETHDRDWVNRGEKPRLAR
jgi:hypothetical protein